MVTTGMPNFDVYWVQFLSQFDPSPHYRLRQVQEGKTPLDCKPLPTFGTGVLELRERQGGNAFRVVHVVSLERAVYVLHAFMKKSKSGIGLPRPDAALIEARLKRARILDAED